VLFWLCHFFGVKNGCLIGYLILCLYVLKIFFTLAIIAAVPRNENDIKNIRIFIPEKYRIKYVGKYILKDIAFEFIVFPIVFARLVYFVAKESIHNNKRNKPIIIGKSSIKNR
jgi:hypothetical protein